MHILIDGDVVVYRTAWASEKENEWYIPRARIDETIRNILRRTDADDFTIFLSNPEGSWRHREFPGYKANRKKEKPKFYNELREFLLEYWNAVMSRKDMEADDELGIHQTLYNKKQIPCAIVSIDKDLLQIPGNHYNYVKDKIYNISPIGAFFNFCVQTLVGDPGDNLTKENGFGCPGIGKDKAVLALEGYEAENDMLGCVKQLYEKYTISDDPMKRMHRTGRLVKICTHPEERWSNPFLQERST